MIIRENDSIQRISLREKKNADPRKMNTDSG